MISGIAFYDVQKSSQAVYKVHSAGMHVYRMEIADALSVFSFVGFDTKWIPFHNTERAAGKTKWNFRSLFRYAMDGMLSFSSAPASLPGFIGMFLLIAAVVTGLVSVFTGHKANWILLLVCLILALNGIQMIFLSLLGQYMSKDYMESKKRPIYIIKKKGGF